MEIGSDQGLGCDSSFSAQRQSTPTGGKEVEVKQEADRPLGDAPCSGYSIPTYDVMTAEDVETLLKCIRGAHGDAPVRFLCEDGEFSVEAALILKGQPGGDVIRLVGKKQHPHSDQHLPSSSNPPYYIEKEWSQVVGKDPHTIHPPVPTVDEYGLMGRRNERTSVGVSRRLRETLGTGRRSLDGAGSDSLANVKAHSQEGRERGPDNTNK